LEQVGSPFFEELVCPLAGAVAMALWWLSFWGSEMAPAYDPRCFFVVACFLNWLLTVRSFSDRGRFKFLGACEVGFFFSGFFDCVSWPPRLRIYLFCVITKHFACLLPL